MNHPTDPADLGLLHAAALLRDRGLSSVELLAACFRRIAERNGGELSFDGDPDAVNAWIRVYPDIADRLARAADKRLAREGSHAPLLCGIPLALKDLYAVKGLPLTASSRVLTGKAERCSSVAWQRLRKQGMVLLGHTHTHEFGAGGTTDQVGNPWALGRSAGGSSGGSAAALAAGMAPAALGTDAAGSLRVPASWCGVSSIKPTHGRVPMGGIIPLAPSLDHPGPMARSLADCSVLLTALCAGGAECTPLMPPPDQTGRLPTKASSSKRPLAGLTIALTKRDKAPELEPDVADGFDHVRRACQQLGATVIELRPAVELSDEDFMTIALSEVAVAHECHAGAANRYRTSVREFVEKSRDFTTVTSYLHAQNRRTAVTSAWEGWFAEHQVDAILEPTTPTVAPLRGDGYESGRPEGRSGVRRTWNVTGFPVAALPAGIGRRTRLPVGVSLIATRGAEARVIQIGIDLQEHAVPCLGPAPRSGVLMDARSGV